MFIKLCYITKAQGDNRAPVGSNILYLGHTAVVITSSLIEADRSLLPERKQMKEENPTVQFGENHTSNSHRRSPKILLYHARHCKQNSKANVIYPAHTAHIIPNGQGNERGPWSGSPQDFPPLTHVGAMRSSSCDSARLIGALWGWLVSVGMSNTP